MSNCCAEKSQGPIDVTFDTSTVRFTGTGSGQQSTRMPPLLELLDAEEADELDEEDSDGADEDEEDEDSDDEDDELLGQMNSNSTLTWHGVPS